MDESLLRTAASPLIRFYRWASPAITIGYFVPEGPVAAAHPGVEIARRRTGGGIVEHGEDLTFALAVPRAAALDDSRFAPLLKASAAVRYRWIHERLAAALRSSGIEAEVAGAEKRDPKKEKTGAGRCFSGPVVSDVIDPATGRKIAGGAQRRSREGWLHQGSVRLAPPHNRIDAGWTRVFCEEMAGVENVFEGSPG